VQNDVPLVGVVMGSDSDWPVMGAAADVLDEFGVPYEADVVSAHRMPREMIAYGEQAASRGLRVIIAGAGGSAHLPGMLASVTPLPVIGVPVPLKYLDGMDSLLSMVQMPGGIPVATVAVGGARNAGLLAVRILATADEELRAQMIEFQARLTAQAKAKGAALRDKLLSPGGTTPRTPRLSGPDDGLPGYLAGHRRRHSQLSSFDYLYRQMLQELD
jgi:5-(carboxyamino)imidazole ribonucleotide mutase